MTETDPPRSTPTSPRLRRTTVPPATRAAILRLRADCSSRQIARLLECSRTLVRRVLHEAAARSPSMPTTSTRLPTLRCHP
jgi:DNA invertase Pin-like site-specific DNA recombinase